MGQFIGMGASILGGTIGAYGAYEEGQASAGAAHYNAAVSRQNAAVERINAQIAEQSGEAQVQQQGLKRRAQIAGTVAHQAASGVDTQSGSYQNTVSSERELGELDALTIRSNAAREAYGYRVKATNQEAEATLKDTEAAADVAAGDISAATTFLGGLSSAGSQYQQWQLNSGKTLDAG